VSNGYLTASQAAELQTLLAQQSTKRKKTMASQPAPITTSIVGVIIEHAGVGNKLQHTTLKAEQIQGDGPRVRIKQGASEIILASNDLDLCVKHATELMAKKRLVNSL